jgi:hypothetical protein
VLGLLAKRLAFLRTVDAAEEIALGVVVVQDFDGVAVENGVASPEESDVAAIPGPCNQRERPVNYCPWNLRFLETFRRMS